MVRSIVIGVTFLLLFGCSLKPDVQSSKEVPQTDFIVLIESLADDIVAQLREQNVSNIAVCDFADLDGQVSDFGKFVAEELTTRLFAYRELTVIERQMLNQIINEQKLTLSGLINDRDAVSLGRISGAQALVTGTVSDLGDRIKINARLISTETGKIFSAASTVIPKNPQLKLLLARGNDAPEEPVSPSPGTLNRKSIEREGFRFEWDDAISNTGQLFCRLTVTSLEKDRELAIFGGSRIFDNLGNQYSGPVRKLGNIEARHSSRILRSKLIKDIPVPLELRFEITEKTPDMITLLEIDCQGATRFKVPLRDLKVLLK